MTLRNREASEATQGARRFGKHAFKFSSAVLRRVVMLATQEAKEATIFSSLFILLGTHTPKQWCMLKMGMVPTTIACPEIPSFSAQTSSHQHSTRRRGLEDQFPLKRTPSNAMRGRVAFLFVRCSHCEHEFSAPGKVKGVVQGVFLSKRIWSAHIHA